MDAPDRSDKSQSRLGPLSRPTITPWKIHPLGTMVPSYSQNATFVGSVAPVSIFHTVATRLHGNPPWLLIDAYIAIRRADLGVTIGDVENAFVDGRS
jgi:hypothetical protein